MTTLDNKYEELKKEHQETLSYIQILEKLLLINFDSKVLNKESKFIWIKIKNKQDFLNLNKMIESIDRFGEDAHFCITDESIESITDLSQEKMNELGISIKEGV